jgi:hypothetical protein
MYIITENQNISNYTYPPNKQRSQGGHPPTYEQASSFDVGNVVDEVAVVEAHVVVVRVAVHSRPPVPPHVANKLKHTHTHTHTHNRTQSHTRTHTRHNNQKQQWIADISKAHKPSKVCCRQTTQLHTAMPHL